jgi:large subunit ribosomal protein L4
VTFAAQPRSYAQKVNKKMYKGAISVISSALVSSAVLSSVDTTFSASFAAASFCS